VVSVLSMWLGAIAAIGQNNIKRLMAYSSIGHMGYALLGLAAGTELGVQSMLVYLAFYAITNIGTFVCIQAMRRDGVAVENISDLSGLARTRPGFAFALAVLMLSLAGLPPLAGIFAKIYVFLAAMKAGLTIPALLGVLASCVGAYYYLRIAKVMYFDDSVRPLDKGYGGRGMGMILAASTAFTVLLVVVPWVLTDPAAVAAQALLR
jgi:NADH-quinone oxidoreductase subunit N